MRIGVVHTVGSPCRCAESVSAGLHSLNHQVFVVDSAEIEIHAAELAQECDLVIDHTDTYCGRGLYRPVVRLLLESWGARVVGSSAKSCFVADNKAAAKKCLSEAGIPVPPGIVIRSKKWTLPDWLTPPLVLKPAFEHMSRGVYLARTEQEARCAADNILESMHQPVLAEKYVPGRELAVSIICTPDRLQVLPVLEWGIGDRDSGILTEEFKLMNPEDEKHRMLRADLDSTVMHELEEFARNAFHALDLRDYARFDIRLSPGGSLFFLEANTTPSLEPMEALAISGAWAGFEYSALVDDLLSSATNRYEALGKKEKQSIHVQIPTGTVELEIATGVHLPPQSTLDMAGLLDIRAGEEVLELGCGSGLLSIAAARMGASRVVAIDLDPRALQSTKQNALRNGVGDRIEIRAGAWYDALERGTRQRFDVIIATPPQTPGPHPFGPKYGGPDGTGHLMKVIGIAPDFLKPGEGRLWLLAVSLANPREVWKRLQECFSEVVLVRETERPFAAHEYEAIDKGLFDYLNTLRAAGAADFVDDENGRGAFRNLFIRAAKPKTA